MVLDDDRLAGARAAAARGDWPGAYAAFEALDAPPTTAEDLEAWSDAAWWVGDAAAALRLGDRAYAAYLGGGDVAAAARIAIGTAVVAFLRGEDELGSGWVGRAQRLLDDLPVGRPHGWLRYLLDVEGGLAGDDLTTVVAAALEVQRLGRELGDLDLTVAGLVGEARARLKRGDAARGLELLDEAMVTVGDDSLSPDIRGNAYCNLMAACFEVGDLERASAWTRRTTEWVASLPAAAVFDGICRVHRCQLQQLAGEWSDAERELTRVMEELDGVHAATCAEAAYELGELLRARGDLVGAAARFGDARELGRDPQPGEALLLAAQGDPSAATRSLVAAIGATGRSRLARARLCPALVEVAIAAGDLTTAADACQELAAAAAEYRTSGLEAAALHAHGALALADGRSAEALPALRAARRRWRDVGAVHQDARVALTLAAAYDAVGDAASAAAERRVADGLLARLGVVDPDRVDAGRAAIPDLTAREAEVLGLVARGATNREVAEALVLSHRTVARHLSNIYTKLGVATRTEAAAVAFRHGLGVP